MAHLLVLYDQAFGTLPILSPILYPKTLPLLISSPLPYLSPKTRILLGEDTISFSHVLELSSHILTHCSNILLFELIFLVYIFILQICKFSRISV